MYHGTHTDDLFSIFIQVVVTVYTIYCQDIFILFHLRCRLS